jgi:hypothetical protein
MAYLMTDVSLHHTTLCCSNSKLFSLCSRPELFICFHERESPFICKPEVRLRGSNWSFSDRYQALHE